jgi:hypothetical protein
MLVGFLEDITQISQSVLDLTNYYADLDESIRSVTTLGVTNANDLVAHLGKAL